MPRESLKTYETYRLKLHIHTYIHFRQESTWISVAHQETLISFIPIDHTLHIPSNHFDKKHWQAMSKANVRLGQRKQAQTEEI